MISIDRLSAGAEFSKQQKMMNQIVETRYFQVGAFLHNSYLQIRNEPIKEYGLTVGMGGSISGSLLYTLSAEIGKRGTTRANLIRENYVQLTIGLSYRDYLFSKGRKYN